MRDAAPTLPRYFCDLNADCGATQRSRRGTGSRGVVRVLDRRLLRFAATVLGLADLASDGPANPAIRVQVEPGIEPRVIARPYSDQIVLELAVSPEPPDGVPPSTSDDRLPLLSRERLWVASSVLSHPHAWDLVEGGPSVETRNLMVSIGNSGIVRMVRDAEWLAACLTALLHPNHPDVSQEALRIVKTSRMKQGGNALFRDLSYDPGEVGPLPLGHARTGHYVLYHRLRQKVALASANQILSPQYLEQIAPVDFWMGQFAWRRKLNAGWAGEAIMSECLRAGRYEPVSRRKGRGRE